ncbi:MAG: hypothetical protein OM95_04255 [Bdellovibrio sp. ArHS]|uniref:hypothetical protein n=1 Tax=Bdellovibrio sp. ArHS TaxID=1569284 RepID=UPI000583A673|nr:hypothetical protein [Bdellovibrio sp. ArHS]KHD89345.1 MAG: hypothetical protein OM95_04255 [Bdellovibrio sp. ArHS]
MKLLKSSARSVLIVFLGSMVGCATLLMLPDELSEQHYKAAAGDIKPQIRAKMTVNNQFAKMPPSGNKEVGILPVVYFYDTTNTLKKNEEAYYTSIFNNSSGSWIRPFAKEASVAISEELSARGFKSFIYSNSDLEKLGMQSANLLMPKEIFGTGYRAIAYNGESEDTNLAMTDLTQFRSAIVGDMSGVVFMKIQADWEPTTANRLNGDIVLNTTIQLGYEMVFCGANSGCVTAQVPFNKGLTSNLFMPNRNTINENGLDKNYELIRSLHGDQLRAIIKATFEKMDSLGTFK